MEIVLCPICQESMFGNSHYPNEICKKCVGRATDGHGRYVRFYNRTISSGCIAFYLDPDGREKESILSATQEGPPQDDKPTCEAYVVINFLAIAGHLISFIFSIFS